MQEGHLTNLDLRIFLLYVDKFSWMGQQIVSLYLENSFLTFTDMSLFFFYFGVAELTREVCSSI